MADKDLIDLIRRLTEAFGPAGREGQVREIIQKEIEGLADSVDITPLGGLNAVVNKGGAPRIMLAAHMDEIGLVISHVDDRGFARFQPIGGLNPKTMVGHRVVFAEGIVAAIGIEEPFDRSKAVTLDQLFLDFGSESDKDSPVRVGEIGAFFRPFAQVGDRLVAKSLDDRIGVAILIESMRQLKETPMEVQFAFTVQEEVGLRGAGTSAFGLEPDLAIAIDVTATGDTPKGLKMAVELGKGPAIKVRDVGMLSDPRLIDLMVDRAEKAKIPYQLEVLEQGRTDAAAIQLTRFGVPSGALSIPCRYIHTPSEMVDVGDVKQAISLLNAILAEGIEI
jgi:endoglucanase